jgi:hypothetical protein
MKVWLVIEEFPDYQRDILVFDSRVKAERGVDDILADYVKEENPLTRSDAQDLWRDERGECSVEIEEQEIR